MRDFHLPGRSAVFATNGLCATSHPLAAKVAVQIMEAGGNAVDAAIAGAALLTVAEPPMCGIGGDCFVLLKPAGDERIIALNGSGRAPDALSADRLRQAGHREMPLYGVESVTVPGAIDAFCRLSDDWGRMGLAASLAPAIHYAETGVPVAPRTAFDWRNAEPHLRGDARKFHLFGGKPPEVGQIYRAPTIAEVLRRVAMDGRDAFYEGEIAQDMVDSLRSLGGVHSLDDFARHRSEYVEPLSGSYKGIELVEHPPNGQGATAILLSNILSRLDLSAFDPMGSKRAHIEAEAAKLAYDARDRFLADPQHVTRMEHMLSPETADRLASLVDPERAMTSATPLAEAVHKDTVYLTVIDKDLMAVSLIYSVYHGFGTGLASRKFGIVFQNRGAGFSLTPGHPNEAGGGKRPMHTIIPAMLRQNGRLTMSFGVMGGAYQPCGHVRIMTNMVDYAMSPQAALDAPRSFADEAVLKVERGYSPQVMQELAALGHRVTVPDVPLGGGQIIRIDHARGVLEGASDPRKDGCALGY